MNENIVLFYSIPITIQRIKLLQLLLLRKTGTYLNCLTNTPSYNFFQPFNDILNKSDILTRVL